MNILQVDIDGRVFVWSYGFPDLASYNDWLNEKRQAMGTIITAARLQPFLFILFSLTFTPTLRYHDVDHITWVTQEGVEYYVGDYTDMLELLNESPLFQGDTVKIALRAQTQHL